MSRYPVHVIRYVQHLRILGSTYNEIQSIVGRTFSKGTLSDWCGHLPLSPEFREKVRLLNQKSWLKARKTSQFNRNLRRKMYIEQVTKLNIPIAKKVLDFEIAKIALAMLCLGEASKSASKSSSFSLGNSDPRIITLFLSWLRLCYPFDKYKVRCRLQCRADQNKEQLLQFWINHTGVPIQQFYPTYVDKRTNGKPTLKLGYKGVLLVTYLDRKVQYDLESLAQIVYNQVLI